jgi:hypothetical protein
MRGREGVRDRGLCLFHPYNLKRKVCAESVPITTTTTTTTTSSTTVSWQLYYNFDEKY